MGTKEDHLVNALPVLVLSSLSGTKTSSGQKPPLQMLNDECDSQSCDTINMADVGKMLKMIQEILAKGKVIP